MRVLLSIKPIFVERILSGEKIFEYRKKIFDASRVNSVIIYATMPVGKIVCEFDIERVIEEHPKKLWEKTHHGAGISKDFFDSYFNERSVGFAIEVGNIRVPEHHICPYQLFEKFTPPQSFMYVPEMRLDNEFEQRELFAA
ncbi:ASCH domain-containing protein [Acetobacter sp. DmW_136]|uniref:ASCH domain-containing protein n=1 Tax=Acetobacteraceae TaxID=433 RepID=UPI00113AEC93|nr:MULTISPECIES: ASCH domain-containing protein [Acetobacteraceae]KAA8386502.1 ASCH domain-containing protein [Acetobacter sp. DmW_136]GCE90268.1 hypothetical protein MSKU15_1869 [Komagataeibacter diospyri]